ncbi:unnamed protein product [Closterium sp. NIES-54]
MQLRHVTILLPPGAESWMWPHKLEGFYHCPRCGITCQVTVDFTCQVFRVSPMISPPARSLHSMISPPVHPPFSSPLPLSFCTHPVQISWSPLMALQADATLHVWPADPPADRARGQPLWVYLNLESWGLLEKRCLSPLDWAIATASVPKIPPNFQNQLPPLSPSLPPAPVPRSPDLLVAPHGPAGRRHAARVAGRSPPQSAHATLHVWPADPPADRTRGQPLRVYLNLESWGLQEKHRLFDVGVSPFASSDVQLTYSGVHHTLETGRRQFFSKIKRQVSQADGPGTAVHIWPCLSMSGRVWACQAAMCS